MKITDTIADTYVNIKLNLTGPFGILNSLKTESMLGYHSLPGKLSVLKCETQVGI